MTVPSPPAVSPPAGREEVRPAVSTAGPGTSRSNPAGDEIKLLGVDGNRVPG